MIFSDQLKSALLSARDEAATCAHLLLGLLLLTEPMPRSVLESAGVTLEVTRAALRRKGGTTTSFN
jgi:hypothetical protein